MAITSQQFNTLEEIFDYYNLNLFVGELPQCLINLSRRRGALGFFATDFGKQKQEKGINP